TLQSSSAAFLRCYNGKIDDYVEEPLENAEALLNSSCYDSTLFNLFYIFGFNGKVKGNLTEEVLNALLNLQDRNTFLVNWEKEAESVTNLNNAGYISSYVGFQLGAALARMSDLGFDLSKTHAMGHSLGAHVLGNAGRYLIKAGKIISRISGCDPAGALFDKYAPIAPALDKSCADFVDITHTDPGGYATNSSKAHLDIWFNYGNFIYGPEEEQVQPGCPVGDYEMFTSNGFTQFAGGAWLRCYKGSLESYLATPLNQPLPILFTSCLDPALPTVVYTFGYRGRTNGPATKAVLEGYIQRKKRNVILLDWEEEAKSGQAGINMESVHLVGHSLGAHIMGFAGKKTRELGQVMPRITGLDPARALFEGTFTVQNGLDRTCARFVDIIHSDPGGYGTSTATGTVDIWPNYGSAGPQPGCPSGDFDMFTPEGTPLP
ncbi:Vitellogenin, partial [Operophtera brumata]